MVTCWLEGWVKGSTDFWLMLMRMGVDRLPCAQLQPGKRVYLQRIQILPFQCGALFLTKLLNSHRNTLDFDNTEIHLILRTSPPFDKFLLTIRSFRIRSPTGTKLFWNTFRIGTGTLLPSLYISGHVAQITYNIATIIIDQEERVYYLLIHDD